MNGPENFDPYGLRQVLSDKIDFDNWIHDNGGNFKEARNLAFAAWQASRRLYTQPEIEAPLSVISDEVFERCIACGNKMPRSKKRDPEQHWGNCPLADRT